MGQTLFRLSKHRYLSYSCRITDFFQDFLDHTDSHRVDFAWYSIRWKNLPKPGILEGLAAQAQAVIYPHPALPLSPAPTCKLQAL